MSTKKARSVSQSGSSNSVTGFPVYSMNWEISVHNLKKCLSTAPLLNQRTSVWQGRPRVISCCDKRASNCQWFKSFRSVEIHSLNNSTNDCPFSSSCCKTLLAVKYSEIFRRTLALGEQPEPSLWALQPHLPFSRPLMVHRWLPHWLHDSSPPPVHL